MKEASHTSTQSPAEGRQKSFPSQPPHASLKVERAKVVTKGRKGRLLTCLGLGDRIRELLELGNKKAIHIVGVRIEAASRAQSGVEAPFSKASKTFLAKVQTGGHQPHIPLFQGIVYHPLVLFHLDYMGETTVDGEAELELQGALRGKEPPSPAPSCSATMASP